MDGGGRRHRFVIETPASNRYEIISETDGRKKAHESVNKQTVLTYSCSQSVKTKKKRITEREKFMQRIKIR